MSTRVRTGRRTALVTGASRGIGRELARRLAMAHVDLVLVARNRARLEEVAGELRQAHGVECTVLVKDLAQPGAGRELLAQLHAAAIEVDVLVNNAGFGTYGPFAGSNLQVELEMVQLNVAAPVELTRACLDGMIERRWGRVLNVASTAAFQPGPLMAVYYASKAFVLHFSEALGYELRGTGVSVTCLCPGPTATGFQEQTAMEDSRLFRLGVMDAEAVARAGIEGLMRRRPVVVPGLRNRAGAAAIRFVPRRLVPPLIRRLQDRVHGA